MLSDVDNPGLGICLFAKGFVIINVRLHALSQVPGVFLVFKRHKYMHIYTYAAGRGKRPYHMNTAVFLRVYFTIANVMTSICLAV